MKLKVDWANWDMGARIIFVAACAATLSMFMDWVSIGFASQSGLTQGAFLLLGLWVYPVLMLLKGLPIRRSWGLILSCSSVVLTALYISSKSIEVFGKTINAAATGAWLFLLVSMVLTVGIAKYIPVKR
jgi:hypothetical protein